MGSYIHTVIRDGIPVLVTSNINETYEFLVKIGDTLDDFGFDGSLKSSSVSASQIKKKKLSGVEVYKQQLCCIPGISSKKAEDILNTYKNLSELIYALRNKEFKIKGIGQVLIGNISSSLLIDDITDTVIVFE